MKRSRTRGGIRFGPFQGTPRAFGPDAAPQKLWIPLRQGFGEPVEPLVGAGDTVLAGQIIGRNDEVLSSPIHAPFSGKIEQIATVGEEESRDRIVVLAADGKDDRAERQPIGPDFAKRPAEEVARALYEAGVTGLGRAGIPTAFHSSPANPDDIDTLIVPVFETSPLAPGIEPRLDGRWKELAAGILALAHSLSVERIILAYTAQSVRNQLAAWLNQLTTAELRQVTDRYPQEWDEMLVETLTDRRVPDDGLAVEVGVVCADVHTALAAYQAVHFGQPLIRQEVALVGSGLAQPEIIRAPIGTLVEDLVVPRKIQKGEVRIVYGDSMTGVTVDAHHAAVARGLTTVTVLPEVTSPEMLGFIMPGKERHSYSNAFLSALVPGTANSNDTGIHGEDRPCICCNYCAEVCPRDLMPYQLSKLVRIEEIEEARLINLTGCIECGLCNYVCPSKILLLEDIRKGKQMLAEEMAHEREE